MPRLSAIEGLLRHPEVTWIGASPTATVKALARNNRGNLYKTKEFLARAIADFDRFLRINPSFAAAYNGRGVAYAIKGELEESISDFSRALGINPKFPEAWFNKGLSCEKAGRQSEAQEAYKNFIRYAPPEAAEVVGQAEERLTRREK